MSCKNNCRLFKTPQYLFSCLDHYCDAHRSHTAFNPRDSINHTMKQQTALVIALKAIRQTRDGEIKNCLRIYKLGNTLYSGVYRFRSFYCKKLEFLVEYCGSVVSFNYLSK